MKKKFIRYLKVWWMMSRNSFMVFMQNRVGILIFLFGKVLKFAFFFAFLFFILKSTNTLAGYNLNQTIFFFLTFNLIDVTSQFLFREVYRFRPLVINGGFDLILVKPISSLFRSLMGGADVLDLITIPPLIVAICYFASLLNPSFINVIFYSMLIINGLIIAAAFHIAVISLGIITLEIDQTIMIFRDLEALGKLPIDIYKQPLQGIITYLIPVGIMITLPAKALMGLVSPVGILTSFVLGVVAIYASVRFWNFALRYYTSASS